MILVRDHFYADAECIRRDALAMPFGVKGNFPGTRTAPHPMDVRHAFEEILCRQLAYWPTGDESYNGAFQIVLKDDGESWVHHDETDFAAVLFLNHEHVEGHGTRFFRHRSTGVVRHERGLPDHNEANQPGDWEEDAFVAGRFNRLVLYDGWRYHRSGVPGFGDSLENGRLTQCWFFS